MPSADWIEPPRKTSEYQEASDKTVQFHMDSYHRKVAFAAAVEKRLRNPRSRRYALNPKNIWAAYQIKRSWLASAASDVAAAKAVRRAEQVFSGTFLAKAAAEDAVGTGMDLDR